MRSREFVALAAAGGLLLGGCGGPEAEHATSSPTQRTVSAEPSITPTPEVLVSDESCEDYKLESELDVRSMSELDDDTGERAVVYMQLLGDRALQFPPDCVIVPEARVKKLSKADRARMQGKTMRPACEDFDLRRVHVPYIGADGNTHEGAVDVAASVAEDIADIFDELYAMEFPLHSVVPLDEKAPQTYTMKNAQALDDLSMADNNTSAFNCRYVVSGATGKPNPNKLSGHAKGYAIDVNPLTNPYVTKTAVMPPRGEEFIDAPRNSTPGLIRSDDEMGKRVIKLFAEHGFKWGGDFNDPDFQHFYVPN